MGIRTLIARSKGRSTSFHLRNRYPTEWWSLIETELKYDGYLHRQEEMVRRARKLEDHPLPPAVNYHAIDGLKREAQHKLQEIRPKTLGQAGRISGVTPADISLLAIWLEKQKRRHPVEP